MTHTGSRAHTHIHAYTYRSVSLLKLGLLMKGAEDDPILDMSLAYVIILPCSIPRRSWYLADRLWKRSSHMAHTQPEEQMRSPRLDRAYSLER